MSSPLKECGVAVNTKHYACWGHHDGKPHFPETCSCCGAAKVDDKEVGPEYELFAEYACGARYSPKPQGQTHTAVWWGSCLASN